MTRARRLTAEGLGTAFLLAVVVGSGIMAQRLAGGNVAIALLANAIATGAGLAALILVFGPISGAHFNPVVTMSEAWQGNLPWKEAAPYIAVQIVGRVRWRRGGARHVRFASVFCLHACAQRAGAMVERIRRHLRLDRGDHRLFAQPAVGHAVRGGRVYHCGVLVHLVDLVCQSRRHTGARRHRYLCRHSSDRRSRLYSGAIGGRSGGKCSILLALSGAASIVELMDIAFAALETAHQQAQVIRRRLGLVEINRHQDGRRAYPHNAGVPSSA